MTEERGTTEREGMEGGQPTTFHNTGQEGARCEATMSNGERCPNYPRHGRPFCTSHDPEYAAQQQENRRKGGLSRITELRPVGVTLTLRTTADRLLSCEKLVGLLLDGRIDRQRCATAIQAIASMQTAFSSALLEGQIRALGDEVARLRAKRGQGGHTKPPVAACGDETAADGEGSHERE